MKASLILFFLCLFRFTVLGSQPYNLNQYSVFSGVGNYRYAPYYSLNFGFDHFHRNCLSRSFYGWNLGYEKHRKFQAFYAQAMFNPTLFLTLGINRKYRIVPFAAVKTGMELTTFENHPFFIEPGLGLVSKARLRSSLSITSKIEMGYRFKRAAPQNGSKMNTSFHLGVAYEIPWR